ncbi:hypothetical protein Tcan_09458 [Toxocara canis]|uniref:INO80 complex subunit E n=2 Tax=Toxocara canis TaxID=6265 RepID=A0A0B2VEE0_TOXCA|nr:hypothetical protein Tcan_09458 [Toxocara canis]VDM45196.1 unnamed protein product [Toxocara canis]
MDFEDDVASNGSPIPAPLAAEVDDYDGPPLSPRSEKYRLKRIYLQQKYDYIHLSNNRLRNRLYHIKKEINHLKRLKRILCQRLLMFGDRFMDSCLEIPDSEPTPSGMDKVIGDVAAKASSSKKRKLADSKRALQANEFSSMEEKAKNSIISIIDSVITESHEERMRANAVADGQNGDDQSASASNTPPTAGTDTADTVSDMDGKSMTERMLRPSSIDHLLPSEPDPDPEDVLTGFGENLEENFMAID